jgi:uncharacterized protein
MGFVTICSKKDAKVLDLLDYRRRVTDLYRAVREAKGDPAACTAFRQARDDLFRSHPQSALDAEQKAVFKGLALLRL